MQAPSATMPTPTVAVSLWRFKAFRTEACIRGHRAAVWTRGLRGLDRRAPRSGHAGSAVWTGGPRSGRSSPMRKLLVIGIGAGNPEHLTVQAVDGLNRADVLFIPDKGATKNDLAELRRHI